jgi:hypothetical protein
MIGLEHVLLPLPDPWTVGRNPGLFTGADRSVGSLLAVAQTPTWKSCAGLEAAAGSGLKVVLPVKNRFKTTADNR